MFDSLTDRMQDIFKKLRGHAKLSDKHVEEVAREIRLALLGGRQLPRRQGLYQPDQGTGGGPGRAAIPQPGPAGDQDRERGAHRIAGFHQRGHQLRRPPTLHHHAGGPAGIGQDHRRRQAGPLPQNGWAPSLLVAADIYRPAAIDQLETLGERIDVPVYADREAKPEQIAGDAVKRATREGYDTVIIDTAGRLHIDEDMMDELVRVKQRVKPHEILLVVDAMTGQDAVNVAESFAEVDFDGIILTKLDGDARGGAALSIKSVTGKPIKFAGVGEKLDGLEPFHPDRMASRILGMGDVLTLIEKAQEVYDEDEARELEQKLRKKQFTLEDFLDQMAQLKKMGPSTRSWG